MRRTGLIITAVLILVLGLAVQGSADTSSWVRISAARAGWYDVQQQLFVGEGEVEIVTEDTYITGDYVEWRLERQELVVSGNVVLRQGEDELTGDYLLYNPSKGEGEFLNVKALVEAPKAEGPIFLSSEKVGIVPAGYRLVNGRITTCDLEQPHFHLAVKEIQVYPGEKLIVRGVTYYDNSLPLFYWPYLVIPLDDDSDFALSLPVVGYSTAEGFYVKNTFDYYFNENAYGKINLDLYSKLGLGYGFAHNYRSRLLGSGQVGMYHIPFTEQSKFSAHLNHEWSRGPWRFVTNNSLDHTASRRSLDSRSRLSFTTDAVDASINAGFQENVGSKMGKTWEYGASWRQQLTDNLRLTLNGSVTGQEKTRLTRMVNYLAETTYTRGSQTFGLAVEQKYNSDLLEEGDTPNWHSVNRSPELFWRLTSPRISGTILPVRLELKAGHYHEFPSDTAHWRLGGTAGLLTRYWRPTSSTTISYSGEVQALQYDQGDQQGVLAGRLNLIQGFGKLRFTARFDEQMVFGTSPFRFDQASPRRLLTLQVGQTEAAFSWSASTNYNFLTGKYREVALQAAWRPSDQLRLSVAAGYDLNTGVWGRIVPMLEYSTTDERERTKSLRVGGKYNALRNEWEQIDLQVKTPVGETWTLGYDAVYDPRIQEFKQGQIRIDKDLHCRSVTFAYDHVRGNVAFSITINAFPTLPFGWDSEKGLSLFDVEDVYDLIGVEE